MNDDPEQCIHLLDPATCTLCNGSERERRAQEAADQVWRIITATYDGTCTACDLPIRIGQRIAWRPNTRPVHETCR